MHEPLDFLVEPNDNKVHGYVYRKKSVSAFSWEKRRRYKSQLVMEAVATNIHSIQCGS